MKTSNWSIPVPLAGKALVGAVVLAMTATLAACSPAADDEPLTADTTQAVDSDEVNGDLDNTANDSGAAEPESGEVRDIITNIRESFDNVVEATSDNGVLVAAGLSCPEEGTPFMLVGARGLTDDAEYVADAVPELGFELRSVAQPDGTFRMQSDADPDVTLYTITLATIGSGVTLELPGCAS